MADFRSTYSTCIGPSMYPTLRPGDGIQIAGYQKMDEMRVGDVIVYPHPTKPTDVVHRIVEIGPGWVRTRGDNNNSVDPYTVIYRDIAGKVVSVKRKTRLIPIRGGRIGYFVHKVGLLRRFFLDNGSTPIKAVSKVIVNSGISNVFNPFMKTKVLQIRRGNEMEWILMVGKRAAGRRSAESENWRIRFPYKYFISRRFLSRAISRSKEE